MVTCDCFQHLQFICIEQKILKLSRSLLFFFQIGCDPKQFTGVSIENLPIVEFVVKKQVFIYDIGIEDGDFVGDIFMTTIGKCESTKKLRRYNNHINVNNINNFSICVRCSSYNFLQSRPLQPSSHWLRRSSQKYLPRKILILGEMLIENSDGFNIEYTMEQTLFNNIAFFSFESSCAPSEWLKQ